MLQCHNIKVVSDLIILKECSQLPENAMVVYWDDIQAVRSQNEKADGLGRWSLMASPGSFLALLAGIINFRMRQWGNDDEMTRLT